MAILFCIEPDGGQLRVTRPERLARASVYLRNKLQGVSDGGAVLLRAHAPAIKPIGIMYVLEHLRDGFSIAIGTDFDADTVASVCNVLFAYECGSEDFQDLWNNLKQKSTTIQNRHKRCWDSKMEKKETLLAERLTVSALVLGMPEALEKELGVVLWGLDTRLDTTVPALQDLDALRHQERKQIFEEIQLEHHKLLADQSQNHRATKRLAHEIAERVKSNNLGSLTTTWEKNCEDYPELRRYSPYKLIRRFEDAIKSPDLRPPGPPVPTPAGQPRSRGPKAVPLDFAELGQVLGQGINSFIKRKSLGDSSSAIIERIFDIVETQVQVRQKELARDLILSRDAKVASWRKELGLPALPPRWPSLKGKEPERRHLHSTHSNPTPASHWPSPKGKEPERPLPHSTNSNSTSAPSQQTNGYRSDDTRQITPPRRPSGGGNGQPQYHGTTYGQWGGREATTPPQTNGYQSSYLNDQAEPPARPPDQFQSPNYDQRAGNAEQVEPPPRPPKQYPDPTYDQYVGNGGPVELPSTSTRRQHTRKTPSGTSSKSRRGQHSAPQPAPPSNGEGSSRQGATGALNGVAMYQIHFERAADENSWDGPDQPWHVVKPPK